MFILQIFFAEYFIFQTIIISSKFIINKRFENKNKKMYIITKVTVITLGFFFFQQNIIIIKKNN